MYLKRLDLGMSRREVHQTHVCGATAIQLSQQLRVALIILGCTPELKRKAVPHIDITRCEIHWDGIYGCDLTSGELAAVCWCQ
jgi:hypothetical protein